MRLRTVSILFAVGLFLVSSTASQWERQTSVLAQSSTREPPPIDWSRSWGSDAFSIEQTSDNGLILALGGGLIKIDLSGNMQWSNNFLEKSGYQSYCRSGYQTSDGGYFMAGWVQPSGQHIGDACLVKTDSTGNHLWNKTYGRDGDEEILSAQQTNDGGYVLAGYASPLGIYDSDFYLVKTDVAGNVEWSKTYGVSLKNETARSIQLTADGGYILAGLALGIDNMDGWVVRTDANGNMLWNTTMGRPEGNDMINGMQRTSDGGYIMAGLYDGRDFSLGGFWLAKTAPEGGTEWSKVYGDGDPFTRAWGVAWCARQTSDGGYIAVGEKSDGYAVEDTWLVKTDSYGQVIWNGTYGKGGGRSVIQTSDGGYVVSASNLFKVLRGNPPVATFSFNPTNASVQQKIVFNASVSYDLDEDIVSYVWDFDDGNVSTLSSPIISHSYGSPRTYNVTLTITDSEQLNSSLSREVWVRVPTHILMSVSAKSVFVGFPLYFTGRLYDMYGNGLKNENVTLQWCIGGNPWALLASDITDNLGNYSMTWTPRTVGDYLLKIGWSGNQTFFPAENSTNMSVLSIPTRISIALSTSTSLIGFKVGINGNLTSDIGAVSDTAVLLTYSVTGGRTWNDMTQAFTVSDGRYSAVWMPTATGNYLVKAIWSGNATYPKAAQTVSLAVIPFEERNVFSVISNSTVTELSFESAHRQLTFTVEGTSGTMGYADIYIAKTLINNIEGVEVKLNGTEIEYTTASLEDSWLIHFTYQHSAHTIAVDLGASTAPLTGTEGWTTALVIAVAAGTLTVAGILIRRKRQRRSQK